MDIPYELGHLVCACDPDEVYRNFGNYYKGPNMIPAHKCPKCERYRRTFTAHCRNCKKMFINLFDHPLKCVLTPVCWNCIETFDDKVCNVYYQANCVWGSDRIQICDEEKTRVPAGKEKHMWYPDLLDERKRVTSFKAPAMPKPWTPTGK